VIASRENPESFVRIYPMKLHPPGHNKNACGKSAATYSARSHPAATVSALLKWSEVGKRLDPARFTIKTMPGRIEKVGDLWQAVLAPGIDLRECLQGLEKGLPMTAGGQWRKGRGQLYSPSARPAPTRRAGTRN
jgi:hypothetical protein